MKKYLAIILALMLALSLTLVPAAVSANPGGAELHGTATWSTEPEPVKIGGYSAKLHVVDGASDWAQVSIPVDIAIEDITELKIWEYIEPVTEPAKNRELRIYLGIDSDGDGVFEADVHKWYSGLFIEPYGETDPADLHGDTFIMDWEIHSAPSMSAGEWTQRDILAGDKGVTTPRADGVKTAARYDATIDPSFDSGIPAFIDRLSMPSPAPPYLFIDPGRVELGDRVKVIVVWIGRSSSWMDATVYVDDLTMNGDPYPLELLPPPDEVWVDDSFTDGACGGHDWGYDAFAKIQEGINAVAEAGTVNVAAGEYEEDVTIDVDGLTLVSTEIHGANIKGKVIIGGVGVSVSNVSVVGFKITDFTGLDSTHYAGIWLRGVDVTDILIEGNLIDGTGIWPAYTQVSGIETVSGTSGNAEIVNNEILQVRRGIYANPGFPLEITGNMITAVKAIGTDNSPVVAHYNNLYALPDGYGVEAFGVNVDATYNWWGSASGPYHETANPNGLGNAVSDHVLFEPWLAGPFEESTGAVSMTATSEPAVIGISVDKTLIEFGAVTSGLVVSGPALTVKNEGNVCITVDADITADTVYGTDNELRNLYFYTAALRLNGCFSDQAEDPTSFGSWPWEFGIFGDRAIEVDGSRPVTTGLQCPGQIKADTTYKGTVVLWAEQPPPAGP